MFFSKGGNERYYLPQSKRSNSAKLQTTGMRLLFILKSNKEVEYIIINPWRVCVGGHKKQVESH